MTIPEPGNAFLTKQRTEMTLRVLNTAHMGLSKLPKNGIVPSYGIMTAKNDDSPNICRKSEIFPNFGLKRAPKIDLVQASLGALRRSTPAIASVSVLLQL